ncbi:MAG: DUF1570 domain-containing protein [Candidatus Omnitrophota bacterium]|jgi:hypothetical protein
MKIKRACSLKKIAGAFRPVSFSVLILLFASCDSPNVREWMGHSPVQGWFERSPLPGWMKKIRLFIKRKASGFKPKDTVIFKNGGMLQGIITERTASGIRIQMDEGIVAFPMADISEIRAGETLVKHESGVEGPVVKEAEDGPYPRLYLKNGNIVYGQLLVREGDTFYLKQAVEGGGFASYGFKFDEIEKMRLWKPPDDATVDKSFKEFRRSNMKYFFKKPPYYILSTVESSDAVMYFNALARFYDDFFLHFFDWVDPSKPHGPLAVILFGSYPDFLEKSGLPKDANIAGFYMPKDRMLRLYNVKETAFVNYQVQGSEYVEQMISKDKKMIENLDSHTYDNKWEVYDSLEKAGHDLEKRRMRLENLAREWTIQTIRHEACHQLMHALGYADPDRYLGAWLSEGLSDYMAPENIGEPNRERLMLLKRELDAGSTYMPLQYLMSFESGSGKNSVHKLSNEYTGVAYAQSWAFVYFLRNKYPAAFTAYLLEVKGRDKTFNAEKDIALLEKHAGKKLPELDKEFEAFMAQLMKDQIDPKEYTYYRFFNPLTLFPAPEK